MPDHICNKDQCRGGKCLCLCLFCFKEPARVCVCLCASVLFQRKVTVQSSWEVQCFSTFTAKAEQTKISTSVACPPPPHPTKKKKNHPKQNNSVIK